MPKTAVIIPLFNHEKFIVEALRSVLDQTRPPDRIIIVDDGSTDASVQQAKSVGDAKVEIYEQSNSGAHAALNRAVALAGDCEFVSVLNSDDRYLPDRMETALQQLASRPGIQLLCTALQLIDGEGNLLPPGEPRNHWFKAAWSPAGGNLNLCEWLGLANFAGTTSNFVVRRDWLTRNPFRPYRYVHDYFMLADAAIRGVLHVHNETLLEYRVHGSNTISTRPDNLTREILAMHLDLMIHLAPSVQDPGVRAGMADYFRTAWASVSGFRADTFQAMLAQACAVLPVEARTKLLGQFSAGNFPELAEFPNKASVNMHTGAESLGACSGLAERVNALTSAVKKAETARKSAEKTCARADALARSAWVRTGAFFGSKRCREFLRNSGA